MQPLTTRPKLGKCRCQNMKKKVTWLQVWCCIRRTHMPPPEADGAPRSTPSHSWHDVIPYSLSGRRETWPGLQAPCSAYAFQIFTGLWRDPVFSWDSPSKAKLSPLLKKKMKHYWFPVFVCATWTKNNGIVQRSRLKYNSEFRDTTNSETVFLHVTSQAFR